MKERAYSKEIANAIDSFLTEDDWKYSFDENRGMFRFGLNIRGRLKSLNYYIKVRGDDYTVYAVSPIGPDEQNADMMARMAEFICRANYGLINGNFELDFRDGEIRFKSYVNCAGDTVPAADIIRESIYTPSLMFDHYGAGIIDIIFADISAEEAEKKSEGETARRLLALMSDDDDETEEDDGDEDYDDSDEDDDDEDGMEVNMDLFASEGDAQ